MRFTCLLVSVFVSLAAQPPQILAQVVATRGAPSATGLPAAVSLPAQVGAVELGETGLGASFELQPGLTPSVQAPVTERVMDLAPRAAALEPASRLTLDRAAAIDSPAALSEAPTRAPAEGTRVGESDTRNVAREQVSGASREVGAVRESLEQEPGQEQAYQAGGRLQAILGGGPSRRFADDSVEPVYAGFGSFADDAGSAGDDSFYARPGGDKTAREHADFNDGSSSPAPPRPGAAQGGSAAWGWAGRWGLRLLAAGLVFADIHYLGVPLAFDHQVLAHGLYLHAAGALFWLPFAGDASGPLSGSRPVRLVQRLFRSRWVRYLPGAFLAGLGLVALGSGAAAGSLAQLAAGALALAGGWGLYRFGWLHFRGFPGDARTVAAFVGALGALTVVGLALLPAAWALAPGWLFALSFAAAATLLVHIPWRGGPWVQPDWRFYLSLGWASAPFLGYLLFLLFFR